jgi:Uma2 family endonuclease
MTSNVNGIPFEEDPLTSVLALPTGRALTIEDVSRLPEELHYELLNGRLVLTPAALPVHQNIMARLVGALEKRCPNDQFVTPDSSVLVDNHNEPRPDVVVVRLEGAGRSPMFGTDVCLVVEIVSPSSKRADRNEKLKLYAYGGIPFYWVINPLLEKVSFTQFVLGADQSYHKRLETTEFVTLDEPWSVTLDVPSWTRIRDRVAAAARARK